MQTFKYPVIAKILYRYANIPISIVLLFYFLLALATITESWFSLVSAVIHAILLIVINRFYFKSYKLFPYRIETDNEKMKCSNFFLSSKTFEIQLIDIESIKGGMFSNTLTKPIYITDGKSGAVIGIHSHIRGYNKLMTIILSNIKQELYDSLLEKIKDAAQELSSKRKRRK